jgi:acyl-CoA dehydrogenase
MSDRSLLAEVVDELLAKHCTTELVVAAEAGGSTDDLWDQLEQLGLTLAAVPEAVGGSGGSLADACTILRGAGRYAVPLPLAETGLLAGWVLAECGLQVGPGRMTVAPADASESLTIKQAGSGWRISGEANTVPWASNAQTIVALARDDEGRLLAAPVAAAACQIAPAKNLAGEPRDRVRFDQVDVEEASPAPFSVASLELRGALGRALLMLGALERIRDLTITHASTREQFGRPLSRFQAVQHLIAKIARDTSVARAAVELAANVEDGVPSLLEVAAAKVVCGRAAANVSRWAHQVHGAIGVTKEYPLQALTRRVLAWRDEFGSEPHWSARIGEEAVRSSGGPWAVASKPQPRSSVGNEELAQV